jgi:hypothetical protein
MKQTLMHKNFLKTLQLINKEEQKLILRFWHNLNSNILFLMLTFLQHELTEYQLNYLQML